MANSHRSLVVVLWIVAIAAARIVSTYPQLGITFDEPVHLACGMEYLARHTYRIEPQHPPLARVAAALGPYLSGVRPAGASEAVTEGVAEFYQDGRVRWHLVLARMGILPFFVLASLTVYFWARRHFGELAAVLSTAIFTLFPAVLAHSGLGTTDMPLAACMGAAFLALMLWAEAPTMRHGLLLGGAAALAVLSKFTAMLYLPASAALALAAWCACARPHPRHLLKLARARLATLGAATATGALVIWAGYRFSYGRLPDWPFAVPAPELFYGLYQVSVHNELGHPAYFFGQFSPDGWWYFFPVMLALKTPVALLVLAAGGMAAVWGQRRDPRYWMPVALAAGTLGPAMAGQINIGSRHVLPVYLALAILAGLAAERMLRHARARWLAAALLLWAAVSGVVHHPDYLSYFNEFVPHPEKIVADSDIDWGQGSALVAARFRKMGVTQATCTFWNIENDLLRIWPGLDCQPLHLSQPATGWVSVGVTEWRFEQYTRKLEGIAEPIWFESWKPVALVGGQLLYYYPPPGEGSPAPALPGRRDRP